MSRKFYYTDVSEKALFSFPISKESTEKREDGDCKFLLHYVELLPKRLVSLLLASLRLG
jgi:hypothetical protein